MQTTSVAVIGHAGQCLMAAFRPLDVTVRPAVPVTVQAIAGTAPYLLSLPNNASVAELLINSRLEASI